MKQACRKLIEVELFGQGFDSLKVHTKMSTNVTAEKLGTQKWVPFLFLNIYNKITISLI